MKKLLAFVLTIVLCSVMIIPTLAADQFYEISFGNDTIVLSKNRKNRSVRLADYGLIEVDKELNIDCANGDIEELTQYLEENVEGFDSETCKAEMISNSVYGRNEYTVLYGLHINGFETAFRVIVFVEDDTILYSSGLNDVNYDELAALPALLEESYDNEIETAKKEALKEVPETADVESQKVRKFLDENLIPQLIVETTCIDKETGGGFLLGYVYNLK